MFTAAGHRYPTIMHLHFSGPLSSLSHPLHYPGDPYYVNSVASEMSADRPASQVSAGCCSAPHTRGVGGTGVTSRIVDIYLDGVAGGSGRPFSAGLLLFLEAGTTFSGYLLAGLRTRAAAGPGRLATDPVLLCKHFVQCEPGSRPALVWKTKARF